MRRDTKDDPPNNYALKYQHAQKKIQSFQKLGVIYSDNIYMWFMVNMQIDWFNQNIKYFNDIKFEIKSQTLNMFQLHKNKGKFYN